MLFRNNLIDDIIIGIYNIHFDIIECMTDCFIIISLEDIQVYISNIF